MFKPFYGICEGTIKHKGCGNKGLITTNSRKLCQKCESERKPKQAPKKASGTKTPQARGWETKRANAKNLEMFKHALTFGKDKTAIVTMSKAQHEAMERNRNISILDPQQEDTRGLLTRQADLNAGKSIQLYVELHSLLNNLVKKLGGDYNSDERKEFNGSELPIYGNMQRTEINIQECLQLVERIDNLQREML